jgi:eukaryotic-like serine/threonine-protein kinase
LRQLVLAAQTEQLGRGQPNTLLTLQALHYDYTALKQWADAEPLGRDLLEDSLRKNAADSVLVANAQATLGSNLLAQKKFVEAEPFLRSALASREKKNPDDYLTFNACSMLGVALAGQKKYADAEPLLLSGYEGIKAREAKLPGANKLRLREAIERLVQFYIERNDAEKTATWQRTLDEFMRSQKPAPTTEN